MNIELNKRLLDFRNSLSMKQGEFAASLGIKQGTLSDIERNRIGVSNRVIQQLEKVYEINRGWFHTGEGNKFLVKNLNSEQTESENLSQNVPFCAKIAQKSPFDIASVIPGLLDDIIKEKLFYMDFYLAAISQHLYSKSDKQTADIKDLKEVVKFIKSLTNKHSPQFQTELRPAYLDLNTADKAKLIKELEGYIRTILDKIWLVTRDLKEVKL